VGLAGDSGDSDDDSDDDAGARKAALRYANICRNRNKKTDGVATIGRLLKIIGLFRRI